MLGTSETKLFVFDNTQNGEEYQPVDATVLKEAVSLNKWQLMLNHVNGTVHKIPIDKLVDLKQMPAFKNFAGSIMYRTAVSINDTKVNQDKH